MAVQEKQTDLGIVVGGRYRLARKAERAWSVGEGTLVQVMGTWGSSAYTVDALEGPMRGYRFQVKASELVGVSAHPSCITAPLTEEEEAAAEEWEGRLPR